MATKKKTEDQVEEQPKPKTKRKPKAVSVKENPVEEAPKVQDNIPAPGEQRDVDISEIPQEIRDNIIGSMTGSPNIASTLAGIFAQTPPSSDANLFTSNQPPVEEAEASDDIKDEVEDSIEGNTPPPISYKESHGGSFRAFDYMNEDKTSAPSNSTDHVEVIQDSYHDYGLNSVDAEGNVQQNQTNDLLMGLLMNAAKKNEEGVEFNEGVKQILAGVLKTLEIHDY